MRIPSGQGPAARLQPMPPNTPSGAGTATLVSCQPAAPIADARFPRPTDEDIIDLTAFHDGGGADLFAKVDRFLAKFDAVSLRGLYLWKHRLATACDRTSAVQTETTSPREMILLSSNNYLGLTTHPSVIAAHCDAAMRFGTGSGSAPFASGTSVLHRQLEQALACRKHTEDCMLFSSGYAANLGVITALARTSDTIFIDRLAHASIIDGARASGARVRFFHHNDVADLDRKLMRQGTGGGATLVVVDAVYSMDGDIARLPDLLGVSRRHGAVLLVDEAHSTGVLGPHGSGIAEHFGEDHDFLVTGTMSKALASVGGFFAGPRKVVEYVRHYARSAMFSTALPPSAPATALAALQVIDEEPERIARLGQRSRQLRDDLIATGLPVGPTESPIVPVIIGDQPRLLAMARRLEDLGVHASCVFYPVAPRTECRLRLSVTANHTPQDLSRAVQAIVLAHRLAAPERA